MYYDAVEGVRFAEGVRPPAAVGENVVGFEAECERCGETFVPDLSYAEEDGGLFHAEREDGAGCGGEGVVVGWWA